MRAADDIRAKGWAVAVHNDYRLNGARRTFWLFTKDGRAVKGEGATDAEALREVRRAIAAVAQPGPFASLDPAAIRFCGDVLDNLASGHKYGPELNRVAHWLWEQAGC